MARNRQRAKERQARRKAREGDGGAPRAARPGAGAPPPKDAPKRRRGNDPIADDVLDELERESVVASSADPVTPPPLSESERALGAVEFREV